MHTGHVLQGSNTSSFASKSAVSVGLHLPAHQTGESGALTGGNCQPSVDQLHVDELFQGTAQCHQKYFVHLTGIVVRVQLLHSEIQSAFTDFPLKILLIRPKAAVT